MASRRSTDHLPAARPDLVVRTLEGWALTPLDGRVPDVVDLPAVVALVQESANLTNPAITEPAPGRTDSGAWSARSGRPWVEPIPLDAVVFPTRAVVGQIIAGGVLVEDHGQRVLLDTDDLTLLDVLRCADGVLVADALAAVQAGERPVALTEGDIQQRLATFAAAGLLRWFPEHHVSSFPTPEPAPAADRERSQPALTIADRVRNHLDGWQRSPALDRFLQAAQRATRRRSAGPTSPEGPEGPRAEPGAVTVTTAEAPADPDPLANSAHGRSDAAAVEPPLPTPDRRIPVVTPYQASLGPPLSVGMLLAAARHADGGQLNDRVDLRPTATAEQILAELTPGPEPVIVLCSNYLWSLDANLTLAAHVLAIRPNAIVVHGGPHTPRYESDCAAFFDAHRDLVHVTVRGEGEHTLVDLLDTLVDLAGDVDLDRLSEVAGLTFRSPTSGELVTTPDRDRIADLDALPSPYLTGEFDHLPSRAFPQVVTFESNRGCPYGCTFCDWGSSTMSRIRRFDLDRVRAEMAWAADRGLTEWVLADANLGIMSRDVELIDSLAELREQSGVPASLGFNVAKNTTKHLTAIMARLVSSGVSPHVSLALQTTNPDTLEAIERSNIETDHYVELAASFRRQGLPLQADLMLGLPGQTLDTFRADIDFLLAHDIPPRIWITQLLPNAPMNDPAYRERFAIGANHEGIVTQTASYDVEDRAAMMALRLAHTVFGRFGLLRLVADFLRWDLGIPTTTLYDTIIRCDAEDPFRYPRLSWCLRYFDFFGVAPLGWSSFYAEVRELLHAELAVPRSSALTTVLEAQQFLMPEPGRRFPDTVALEHDLLSWHRSATASLWTTGHAAGPEQPLSEFGPARLSVFGDPLDRCGAGLRTYVDPRSETVTDEFWLSGHFELDSPLVVTTPDVAGAGTFVGRLEQQRWAETLEGWHHAEEAARTGARRRVAVELRTTTDQAES